MFRKDPTQKIKEELYIYEQKNEERRKKHVKKMIELIEKCYKYQNRKK